MVIKKEDGEVLENLEEIPEKKQLFDKEKWIEKRKERNNNLERMKTEESMQALYHLFLERISFKYGKQYEHMTLQEIQNNAWLPKGIIELLALLYQPIYNESEKDIAEKQKIAEEMKCIVIKI